MNNTLTPISNNNKSPINTAINETQHKIIYYYNPIINTIQFCHYCLYDKKMGLLKLYKSLLTFETNEKLTNNARNDNKSENINYITITQNNTFKLEININQIVDVSSAYNEKNSSELLRIETIDKKKLIFRFQDISESYFQDILAENNENVSNVKGFELIFKYAAQLNLSGNNIHTSFILSKKEARDKLYDLLVTRNLQDDDTTMKASFLKKMNCIDQNKIFRIIEDTYMLYSELCMTNILKYDEYSKFIRKKYNNLYCKNIDIQQMFSLASKKIK